MSKMDVRLLDIAVMLNYLMKEEEHLDAERTLAELRQMLNLKVYVDKEAIESALFSCRLADEKGVFEHPDQITFWEMVNRITPKTMTFDKIYNVWEDK